MAVVQFTFIVLDHIIGVVAAHNRAVRLFAHDMGLQVSRHRSVS